MRGGGEKQRDACQDTVYPKGKKGKRGDGVGRWGQRGKEGEEIGEAERREEAGRNEGRIIVR